MQRGLISVVHFHTAITGVLNGCRDVNGRALGTRSLCNQREETSPPSFTTRSQVATVAQECTSSLSLCVSSCCCLFIAVILLIFFSVSSLAENGLCNYGERADFLFFFSRRWQSQFNSLGQANKERRHSTISQCCPYVNSCSWLVISICWAPRNFDHSIITLYITITICDYNYICNLWKSRYTSWIHYYNYYYSMNADYYINLTYSLIYFNLQQKIKDIFWGNSSTNVQVLDIQ